MKKRAERAGREQGPRPPIHADAAQLRQLLFPMVAGIAATRTELMAWVHAVGLSALEELLRDDAARIAGPKGVHRTERTHHHWGSVPTELPLGGRRVTIKRPRVRSRSGREEVLPTLAHLRGTDPLPERVVNQILVGVSTRGYDASLEAPPAGVRSRGTSRSAVTAAGSLREGLEETLTVIKLALPSSLRRSLSTTNSVENLISSIRKVTRNVKRWRGADMARRWTALGIHHAERHFRRFRGFEALPVLVAALKKLQPAIDADQEAA